MPISEGWTIPAKGHLWGEWKVTKAATTTEEGIETRVCQHDPTHVETRAIAKLDDLSGTKDAKKSSGKAAAKTENKAASKSTNPKTGDEETMALYLLIFIASVTTVVVIKKRHN